MASLTPPLLSLNPALRAPSRALVVMVGLAIMLNYIDRGAISIAAPLIKDEMRLTATGYGLVVSSFFWTYVPMLMLAGWLADKVSVNRLMAAGVAVWALATLITGFAGGLVSLVILRLLMGIGEGVAFPSASKLLARAPEASRGTANLALAAGLAVGPLVGTLAGGFILARYGWRPMFIVFGLVTLVWLVPWLRMRAQVDLPAHPDDAAPVAYAQLLRTPALWAMSIYHFAGTYALYFVIAWLPLWLVKVRGYDITDMALLTALFYLGQTIGAAFAAGIADRIIAGGRSASVVRRSVGIIGFAMSAIGILAISQTTTTAGLMFWLVMTSVWFGSNTGIIFTAGQTLAGPASAGRWVGVQSAVGNLAGITGPVATGLIVDSAGYGPAFVLAAGIVFVGLVAFVIGVPRLAPTDWKS